mgnify:CR=1 FL=1
MKSNKETVGVMTICPHCNQEHIVEVPLEHYKLQKEHPTLHIQEVFTTLSSEEREMLISGICPTCWDEIFSYEEDEEDYE